MTQAQELEAADRQVKKFKPTNPAQQKLISDWLGWYGSLTWYDRNMNDKTLPQARAFMNELIPSSIMGAEATKISGNFKKKGTSVPTPDGYRRAQAKEISPTVQSFAKAALANFASVSKKKGEAESIGMRYSAIVDGKQYLSQCEWHFDNHPKGGAGNPFWHMGSSIFVPKNPIPKEVYKEPAKIAKQFKTADSGLASLMEASRNNPYA